MRHSRALALLTVLALAGAGGCGGDAQESREDATEAGEARESEAARLSRLSQERGGDLIDLSGVGFDLGPADAPLTVVEFADFGCSYCRQFAEQTFPVLREEFIAPGKVRWKFVPFVLGMFPNAAEGARAGECAGRQDRFWAMHDLLFSRQEEWTQASEPRDVLVEAAREAELDVDAFTVCYDGGRTDSRTRESTEIARDLGIRGTPTFFIEGFPVQGAIPPEPFTKVLREVLREKKAAGGG